MLPNRVRLVVLVALGVVGLGLAAEALGEWRLQRRLQTETRRADDAEHREAEAKTKAAASGALAEGWRRECASLQSRLDSLPRDPGPRPVAPDAALPVVVSELRGLGLSPWVLGADPALGLNLPDSRTVLFWGREAQRVGPLAARLEACTALARAQEGATGALLQQTEHLTTALSAADDRATAQERRADTLDQMLRRRGPEHRWSAGLLVGRDPQGHTVSGASASWSWRRVEVQAVQLGDVTAVGAGWRW